MDRHFDEILAELALQVDRIESIVNSELEKTSSVKKRMDFTIRRMVKAETRLDGTDKRMIAFDRKLEESILDLKKFSEAQSKMNQYFLDYIEQHPLKKNGNGR